MQGLAVAGPIHMHILAPAPCQPIHMHAPHKTTEIVCIIEIDMMCHPIAGPGCVVWVWPCTAMCVEVA